MHALTASLLSLFLMTPLASGWLGVYLASDGNKPVISEVIPGTPAQKAGLKAGDIMLSVGDTKTPTREKFIEAIQGAKPGARVKIRLERSGRERVVIVRLGERPKDVGAGAIQATPDVAKPKAKLKAKPKAKAKPKPKPKAKPKAKPAPRTRTRRRSAPAVESKPRPQGREVAVKTGKGYLGISVREADSGLVVDRVLEDGPCAKSGLKKGDIIVSIGDRRIRSLDDLDGALKKIAPGRRVSIGVKNKKATKSLMVKVGRRPGTAGGRVAMQPKPVRIVEIVESPKPVVRKPVVRKPVVRKPVVRKPVVRKPVVRKPVVRKPVVRKPVVRKPAVRKPVVRKPVRIAKPSLGGAVVPSKPVRVTRSARPAEPSRATPPRKKSADYNLSREIRELRKELKELRKLLNELRRDKKDRE